MRQSWNPHVVNLVGAASQALADRIQKATAVAAGESGAAPAALVALDQFLGGRSTEALAQVTGLTHSGTVRLVDRLVEAGLVERRPGHDARSLSIVLTRMGRARSRKISKARAAAVESALAGLDPREYQGFASAMEALVAHLTVERLGERARGEPPAGWLCRLCDFDACGRPVGDCPAATAAADHNAAATERGDHGDETTRGRRPRPSTG
jgi:DNA-binding MarR family transcriptional regulator